MSVNDPTDRGGGSADWEAKFKETNAELANVRREAAGYRTGAKGQFAEATKSLAALAGVNPDAEDRPDVQSLVKLVQGQVRELKVRAGLAEAMHKHGARPSLTRAYLLDSGAMKRFDPDADDFAEVLDDALTEAFEQEPALRGGGATARKSSSDGMWGDAGQRPQYTRDEIAAMPPEEVVRLHKSGRLDHLTGERH